MIEQNMERIVPALISESSIGYETVRLHLERYAYAGNFILPGAVMDVACGVGYGSHYLAEKYTATIKKIIGVDIDNASIAYARMNYKHAKIEYNAGDALEVIINPDVRTVVSLETIEHLKNPDTFIHHIAAQLKKGSRFIASVPITPSMDANPFHLHDFTKKNFTSMLLKAGFKELDHFIQIQHFHVGKVLHRKAAGLQHLRKNMLLYYAKHPEKLLLRIAATLQHGFTNKYFVGVFEKL